MMAYVQVSDRVGTVHLGQVHRVDVIVGSLSVETLIKLKGSLEA